MKKRKRERLKHNTVYFLLTITLVMGVISGYAWRMSQVKNTEGAIVEALNGCSQLITDELVISPTLDCKGLKTAIIGLKTGTFNYVKENK